MLTGGEDAPLSYIRLLRLPTRGRVVQYTDDHRSLVGGSMSAQIRFPPPDTTALNVFAVCESRTTASRLRLKLGGILRSGSPKREPRQPHSKVYHAHKGASRQAVLSRTVLPDASRDVSVSATAGGEVRYYTVQVECARHKPEKTTGSRSMDTYRVHPESAEVFPLST